MNVLLGDFEKPNCPKQQNVVWKRPYKVKLHPTKYKYISCAQRNANSSVKVTKSRESNDGWEDIYLRMSERLLYEE